MEELGMRGRRRELPRRKNWPRPAAVNYATADDGDGALSTLLFMSTDGGPARAAA